MNESLSMELHSIETLANTLSDQTKFRPAEINKIKYYFNSEIQERKTMSKKLSKYIATLLLNYIDKTCFFRKCYWSTCRIATASFTLVFSLTTGIIKKLLKITRKKKKKHNKIVMLAKSKLNCIETLMSQALIDLNISYEQFKTIVNKKEKYEQMKESIRNTKSSDELSENSRYIRENSGNS